MDISQFSLCYEQARVPWYFFGDVTENIVGSTVEILVISTFPIYYLRHIPRYIGYRQMKCSLVYRVFSEI